MSEAALCKFVMLSYRRFGQAFFTDVSERNLRNEAGKDVERPACARLEGGRYHRHGDHRGDLHRHDRPSDGGGGGGDGGGDGGDKRGDGIMLSGEQAKDPPTAGGNMQKMMEDAMPVYERLECAVDR